MKTYAAINLTNKKFQVGSAKNFEKRQKEHLRGKGDLAFQRSLRRDPSNFFWLVGEDDGLETREEEQYYLDFYHGTAWCYNQSPNADGGLCSTPEQLLKAGLASREAGVGVHGATSEQLSCWGSLGGNKTSRDMMEKGTGLFGRDPERMKEDSSKGGCGARDKKVGWYGMTEEEKAKRSKKGAESMNSQKWTDPFDGYIGNPGAVARHMKRNGRDPSEKRRVS
jgi:hypothetical protein